MKGSKIVFLIIKLSQNRDDKQQENKLKKSKPRGIEIVQSIEELAKRWLSNDLLGPAGQSLGPDAPHLQRGWRHRKWHYSKRKFKEKFPGSTGCQTEYITLKFMKLLLGSFTFCFWTGQICSCLRWLRWGLTWRSEKWTKRQLKILLSSVTLCSV